jgi:Glycosyltransferase family 87
MRPGIGLARGLAVVVVVAALAGLGAALWRNDALTYDVGVYRRYGEAMAAGQVPYRDFRLEYPPGALPAFLAPALVTDGEDAYRWVFASEATLLEIATLLVGLALLVRLGATRGRQAAYVVVVATLAALPLGSVSLTRFDFWPAFLLLLALSLGVAERTRSSGFTLGLAIGAKIYPLVVAPLLLIHAWRRGGTRKALDMSIAMALGVAVVFLPFAALAPRRVASSLWEQIGRPLQIESLGAAVVIALHRLADIPASSGYGHGSYNLAGSAATGATIVTGIALVLVLCVLWLGYAGGRATPDRLIAYAAAAVTAFVAFGKVLSPQFLLWLLPLVLLVRGRRGLAASVLLAVAAGLTTIWIPFRQSALVEEFAAFPSWALLLRDVILVVVVFTLVPMRPGVAALNARSGILVSPEH